MPRPRPRAAATLHDGAPEADVPPVATAPRVTLRSVDLEVLADEAPRHSTVPPPLPERARGQARRPALSHPEIADSVFAGLRDLAFFETAIEAASFGLVTAMCALPSLAGLALLRDDDHGGYVVVYARGPRSYTVVRSRVAEDDPVVGLALVRGGPVSVEYGSELPAPARHAAFGDPWLALAAPVLIDDRCVGVIELVDPFDGRTLGESARHALSTVAQHLAVFIGGRVIAVDSAFAPEQVGLEA